MSVRPRQLWAVPLLFGSLLFDAHPARAQPAGPRTDILTGEPVRPHGAASSRSPEIVNAPHAPRQTPTGTGEDPPIDILVTPQVGPFMPGGPTSRRY